MSLTRHACQLDFSRRWFVVSGSSYCICVFRFFMIILVLIVNNLPTLGTLGLAGACTGRSSIQQRSHLQPTGVVLTTCSRKRTVESTSFIRNRWNVTLGWSSGETAWVHSWDGVFPVSLSIMRVCQPLCFLRAPVSIPEVVMFEASSDLCASHCKIRALPVLIYSAGALKYVFDLSVHIGKDRAIARSENLKEIVSPYGKCDYSLWLRLGLRNSNQCYTFMVNIKLKPACG